MNKKQLIEEYWNATGNLSVGRFRRRDLMHFLAVGAMPIVGQMLFIFVLISFLGRSRESNKRVPKKYRCKK